MNETNQHDHQEPPEFSAPRIWRNWRAEAATKEPFSVDEHPMYSDAWFTAEARGRGPYDILNALPRTTHSGGMHEWKPALILRVAHYLPGETPDMTTTSNKHYHGGWLADEVAAVLNHVSRPVNTPCHSL